MQKKASLIMEGKKNFKANECDKPITHKQQNTWGVGDGGAASTRGTDVAFVANL